MRVFVTRHLPAILWAVLVGVVLAVPGSAFASMAQRVPEWLEGWIDKGIHGVLFLVLSALLLRSAQAIEALRRPMLVVLTGALVYVVLLELLQTRVPGRGWDVMDLVVGGVGVVVGLLVARWESSRPSRPGHGAVAR